MTARRLRRALVEVAQVFAWSCLVFPLVLVLAILTHASDSRPND